MRNIHLQNKMRKIEDLKIPSNTVACLALSFSFTRNIALCMRQFHYGLLPIPEPELEMVQP
jgi:hypothetical protein